MGTKEEKIRDLFIDMAVTLGESFGLNRAVCQIYALLYLSSHPLTPAEIGRALQMSKGNVSINMRTLQQWNAVRKVWRKGYTRALYKANEDIEEIVFDRLKVGLARRMGRVSEALDEIRTVAKESEKKGNMRVGELGRKIASIEQLAQKVNSLIQNLDYLKHLAK